MIARAAGGVVAFRPAGGRARLLQPSRLLVLGFLGVILLGTALLSLPVASATGRPAPFLDALFTAVSAVTVTGLVVRDTATAWSPFGQAVILLLIQVGGLGIMTTSTLFALLRGKRITLPERLAIQTALGHIELAGVVRLTKLILLTTLVVEGIGAVLLSLRFLGEFPAPRALWLGLFHAVSAFNNAGFDLFTTSLVRFQEDPFVLLTFALLIITGGMGFTVLADLIRLAWDRTAGRRHVLSVQTRFVLTLSGLFLLLGTVLVLLWEGDNPDTLGGLGPGAKVLNAFFMATTTRTAGFNSVPVPGLREVTLFFFLILMFVGASPGGTGGGVKTTTFGVVAMAVWATIRGRPDVVIFGRRMAREVVDRSLAIVAISLSLVTAAVLVLGVTERAPLLPLLFEAVSAFGTVGLSVGITPELSDAGRLVIALTMFVGRLGPLTLAMALARPEVVPQPIRYPTEKVMVG